MSFNRIIGTGNGTFKEEWVIGSIKQLDIPNNLTKSLFDVGAGTSPYKQSIINMGFTYTSHDFSSYIPDPSSPGQQDKTWEYPIHNVICDILDIPLDKQFSVVLCTEVFEHIPDPIRAFEIISKLVAPGGYVIITVPFLSLMHQAPFWFQSGLSPFWFEYWSEKFELETVELSVQGDYADLMVQEMNRVFEKKPFSRIFSNLLMRPIPRLRQKISASVLESGGFGTLFIGKK